MQRILFFTDRVFWPANDGHKVVLSNYCKGLKERYGCEIHVLSFLEAGQSADLLESKPSYVSCVQLLEKPSKTKLAANLATSLFKGVKGGPIQCALFKSKSAADKLRNTVFELEPDFCFIDLPRLAPFVGYIADLPCKKVLYMEDVFSARYDRQLDSIGTLKKTGGVAGKYSSSLPGGISKLTSIRAFQKIVLTIESKRMRVLELKTPSLFDYVVLVSPLEAGKLSEDANAANVMAIPLGVDCPYYTAGIHPIARKNVVSFLGDMRASANADSLRYIAGEILPLLDSDILLEVYGIVPNELVEEYAENSRISFLGRVEDTRTALRSSSVFLAPIAYGTGIKTKILEAMAIGMPIVTNSVGNEGIGLVDGEEAFVSDDPQKMAQATMRLLNDKNLASRFATKAQDKAIRTFDWEITLQQFSAIGISISKKLD